MGSGEGEAVAAAAAPAKQKSTYVGVVAGMASGMAKLVVGHPFDTLKVRLQTEGGYGRFRGPLHCLTSTVRTEGFRALYKGAALPLFGWTVVDMTMVGVYTNTRQYLQKRHGDGPLPMSHMFVAGLAAGLASCAVVTPVEQVKARLQVQYAEKATQVYKGPIDCIRQLVRNNGVMGLYKGFTGTVMFRSFVPVYFGSYEYYRRVLDTQYQHVIPAAPIRNFIAGGCGAMTLWLVAFPTDTVKNRMMAQRDSADRPYKSVGECIRKIYRAEGVRGFYRGFTPCMMRAFPTNGAAFMSFELVWKYLG